MRTLDEVIDMLDKYQQRASYGAVAKNVDRGGGANGLMQGRPPSRHDSWVVAKNTNSKRGARRGWPTGYADSDIHPACFKEVRSSPNIFIDDPDDLRLWLDQKTRS
jgi:hypothetical protein